MANAKGVMFQFTSPVILAYPNLFTPRKYKNEQGIESGEPKYDFRGVLTSDHPDLPALHLALIEAAKQAWPHGMFAHPSNLNPSATSSEGVPANYMLVDWALRSGDKIADKAKRRDPPQDREAFRGKLVLVSRGQYSPGLSAVLNGRIVDFPMSGNERMAAEPYFYGGVKALVQVQLVGYQVGNNAPVITAYPNVVLSLNEGEKIAAFSGGSVKSGVAAFASYTGHVSTVDPTAGGIAGLV